MYFSFHFLIYASNSIYEIKKYFDNKNLLLLLQHCHNFERNEFLIPCWTVRTAAHGFSFEILIVNIIEKKIIITNIDKSTVHPQIVQEENRISFWKTL